MMRDLFDMWYEAVMGLGEAMVAARRIMASVDADQRRVLVEIARSRTEPANRVERAGIILARCETVLSSVLPGAARSRVRAENG